MTSLTWSESLILRQPWIDSTHREFVDLLAELEAAGRDPGTPLLPCLDRFVDHTAAHFGQEDAWMAAIGFQPGNCHSKQHAQVLELLREVQRRVRDEGQVALVAQLVPALFEWFVPHAQNMDGGLVQVMQMTGFDPATGTMTNPPQSTSDAVFEPAPEPAATGASPG
jgi:hemerythrin-like metal-binding protein